MELPRSPPPHAPCLPACAKRSPLDFSTALRLQLALDGLDNAIEEHLRRALGHSLRPVINATGVILHTNLGRAPLAEGALAHIHETAGHFSNLEFDVEAGERGKRDVHVDRLFRSLLSDGGTSALDDFRLGFALARQPRRLSPQGLRSRPSL